MVNLSILQTHEPKNLRGFIKEANKEIRAKISAEIKEERKKFSVEMMEKRKLHGSRFLLEKKHTLNMMSGYLKIL